MPTLKSTARLAGGIYLILVVLGIISLLVIPSQLYVWDNPSRTVENIREHEAMFRLGIGCGLLCFLAYLLLPLALYRLLSPVNKTAATLMVALAVSSVPISFVNANHLFEVLRLLSGQSYVVHMDGDQLSSQIMMALHAYNDGSLIAQLFWGLWLFPFGFLVFKSGFLPKVLGLLLMIGSLGYTFDFAGRVFWIGYSDLSFAQYITIPASIGEIGICLWLLIPGARDPVKTN